jgi:hypothetical protein
MELLISRDVLSGMEEESPCDASLNWPRGRYGITRICLAGPRMRVLKTFLAREPDGIPGPQESCLVGFMRAAVFLELPVKA